MVFDRELTIYRCPKCSHTSHDPRNLVKHTRRCKLRKEDILREKAFYDIPPGLGEPLARETFITSIAKTQLPWDDYDGWRRAMWDTDVIEHDQVMRMMRQAPVNAAMQFFETFLHKDTGVQKYMNFIKNGNNILEVRLRNDPTLGTEVITHPLNETTYEKIAVWVMAKTFNYHLPLLDVDTDTANMMHHADGGTYFTKLVDMWMKKALRCYDGTAEMKTAYDTFADPHVPKYHPGLDKLKELIKLGLPTKDHVKYRVSFDDCEVIQYEPKGPGTFVAWMCRGCRKSFPLKDKARRHQETCPARSDDDRPPKILGVRVRYALDRPVDAPGWTENINGQVDLFDTFMRTRIPMDDSDRREWDTNYMDERLYMSIFKQRTIEDLMVSVFSHFYGRRAIKQEYASCFRTGTTICFYTTRYVPGVRCDAGIVSEVWPSPAGYKLLLTEMRKAVYILIKVGGYVRMEDLSDEYKTRKRIQLALRNVYRLDREHPPGMDISWNSVDFSTLSYDPRQNPKLKEFARRLVAEIPLFTDI